MGCMVRSSIALAFCQGNQLAPGGEGWTYTTWADKGSLQERVWDPYLYHATNTYLVKVTILDRSAPSAPRAFGRMGKKSVDKEP